MFRLQEELLQLSVGHVFTTFMLLLELVIISTECSLDCIVFLRIKSRSAIYQRNMDQRQQKTRH